MSPALAPPAFADTGIEQWGSVCKVPGLTYATPLPSDKSKDGGPVRVSQDKRGRFVPILMVHGWTGSSTQDIGAGKTTGNFSLATDLTQLLTGVPAGNSLIGKLQNIPGAGVYTFDYHDYSARWVTDDNIGQRLSESIDCLNKQSGEKVIVIAHSMGGLATRQAMKLGGPSLESKVSQVIEYGTPNNGSDIAAIINNSIDVNSLSTPFAPLFSVLKLLLSLCGQSTAGSLDSYDASQGLCKQLGAQVASLTTNAGRALSAGSPELRDLPPMPPGIPVHALAGDIQVASPGAGFFFTSFDEMLHVSMGDEIVPLASARSRSLTQDNVTCKHVISFTTPARDELRSFFQMNRDGRDNAELMMTSGSEGKRSPCFHGNLMQTVELDGVAIRYVASDIQSRYVPVDLRSVVAPAACKRPETKTVDGKVPNVPEGQGMTVLGMSATASDDDGGSIDAAASFECSAGGVMWPSIIGLYGRRGELLSSIDLAKVTDAYASTTALKVENDTIAVSWVMPGPGEGNAQRSLKRQATFKWDGSKVSQLK